MYDKTVALTISRRSFIKTVTACSGLYLFNSSAFASNKSPQTLRFGLIADLHQDIMYDATERIRTFTGAMNKADADFVCQLGDFCAPNERNREFINSWKSFEGSRYSVIGNHDMDGGYKVEQTVSFLDMPANYYSFDNKGVHFMVLDGNNPGGKAKGRNRYVDKAQRDWIKSDLNATLRPSVVFIHQPVDGHNNGLENSSELRALLEEMKTPTGVPKVIACFCGHNHDDSAVCINGIHYIRINSASYLWIGSRYKKEMFNKEIHRKYPSISATVTYKDPLWAFIEIDPAAGSIIVKGMQTSWVGPTPWERGISKKVKDPKVVAPRISDRRISLL